MNLENNITKINSLIKDNGRQVNAGEVPNMVVLEKEIATFLESVKNLSPIKAREYLNLVDIWTKEIKIIYNKLNETKDRIELEISQAHAQGRAATAYTTAKHLAGSDKK